MPKFEIKSAPIGADSEMQCFGDNLTLRIWKAVLMQMFPSLSAEVHITFV